MKISKVFFSLNLLLLLLLSLYRRHGIFSVAFSYLEIIDMHYLLMQNHLLTFVSFVDRGKEAHRTS